MSAAPIPAPRVIIESGPDGALFAEFYTNGARTRTELTRGFEMYDVREILAKLASDIASAATRKAERQAAEEKSRHSRIYWHAVAAHGQGEEFANRIIGKPDGAAKTKAQLLARTMAQKPILADANLV